VQSLRPSEEDSKSIRSATLHVMQQVVGSRVGAWPNGQIAVGSVHDFSFLESQLPDKPFCVRHVGQPVEDLIVGMTPAAQMGASSNFSLLHCTVPVVRGIHVGQHLLLLANVWLPVHKDGMVDKTGHWAISDAEQGLQLGQQVLVSKRGCGQRTRTVGERKGQEVKKSGMGSADGGKNNRGMS
jgi:hypothetical protein